jgi:hypothetical protein
MLLLMLEWARELLIGIDIPFDLIHTMRLRVSQHDGSPTVAACTYHYRLQVDVAFVQNYTFNYTCLL